MSLIVLWPAGVTLLKSEREGMINVRPQFLLAGTTHMATLFSLSNMGTGNAFLNFVLFAVLVLFNYWVADNIRKLVALKTRSIALEGNRLSL